METTDSPTASPEQMTALRRNQAQRLRDQAEALLRAVEQMDAPKTPVEADRTAKALMSVDKLLNALDASDVMLKTTANLNAPVDAETEIRLVREVRTGLDRRLSALEARRTAARYANIEAQARALSATVKRRSGQ